MMKKLSPEAEHFLSLADKHIPVPEALRSELEDYIAQPQHPHREMAYFLTDEGLGKAKHLRDARSVAPVLPVNKVPELRGVWE